MKYTICLLFTLLFTVFACQNSDKSAETVKQAAKKAQNQEKTTLGDIDALAELKAKLEKGGN